MLHQPLPKPDIDASHASKSMSSPANNLEDRHSIENSKSEDRGSRGFLRKQTVQAYDFAKGMSTDEAKKLAAETAKKAKRWGGSLLSSLNATINTAKGATRAWMSFHIVFINYSVSYAD